MDPAKNFGFVTVSTGYDASAITIVLSTGHGAKLPDPAVDGEFNLTWYDSINYPNPADDPNVEIVRVTARSTDILTVTRGTESTIPSTKNTASATYKMFLGVTAKTITDISLIDTGRATTLVIAASDSSTLCKVQADYVCDGIDDQVQIQQGIDSITANGGDIYLSNGVYNISSTIDITNPITWHGCGPGEHWAGSPPYGYYGSIISADAGFTGIMINITGSHHGGGFFDMGFSGYNMNQNVLIPNTAIYVSNSGDFMVHHCFIFNLPFDSAIRLNNHGSWIDSCDFEYNRLTGTGAVHITNQRNWITNSYFSGNKRSIEVDSKQQRIHNCVFRNANRYHLACLNPLDHKITGNSFDGWNIDNLGYSCIQFYNSPLYCHVVGNSFDATDSNGTPGIDDNGTALDYCNINNNIFNNFGAVVPIDFASAGSHNVVRNNIGYTTENSGTATLVNGTTSIAITHGLNVTPSAGDIVVTPIEAWGSMTQFYIDTYTSTQFTIHSNVDPGQDVDFAWKAVVL